MRNSAVRVWLLLWILGLAPVLAHDSLSLQQKIGQMIVIGFQGTVPEDRDVRELAALAREGAIGGVIFFGPNIVNPAQTKALTRVFREAGAPLPLFVAVDQEGGKVQRLSFAKGFPALASAEEVARHSVRVAKAHDATLARTLRENGFNLALGPVVDLAADPSRPGATPCPVIGGLGRSYGVQPAGVALYAGAYVQACRDQGVLTALKHFPGHGLAADDTHRGMTDITTTFRYTELLPFDLMIRKNQADMIMMSHVMHRGFDPRFPVSLSSNWMNLLRRRYDGVIITDCLNMNAIQKDYGAVEPVAMAVVAGADLVLVSNHAYDSQGRWTGRPLMPSRIYVQKITDRILGYIHRGLVPESGIEASFKRIAALKARMNRGGQPQ